MKRNSSGKASGGKSERDLWIASELYMRGRISMERLEEIERSHTENLKEAVLAIARQNLEQQFALDDKTQKTSSENHQDM